MSRMPHKSNGAGPDPRVRFVSTTKPSKKKRKKKRAKQQPLTTRREKMLADLARSGLDASDAERLQCKPVSGRRAKELLGISKVKLPDGSIIPYFNGAGKRIKGAFRWRALGDYSQRDAKTGKREPGPKYRQTLGSKPRLYFSPLIDWRDVDGPIVITEGEKKAACACKVGIATIGLGGVWNWKVPKSDDQLLPDFAEVLEDGADVVLCFDTDSETNSNVRLALARLAAALEKAGYGVSVVYLPSGKDGEKAGLDDFLVAAGRKDNGKLGLARARRAFEKLPRNDPPPIDPIRIISAADVKPEPVRPVWQDVLYLRKVTLVAGEPGLGKSLLTCDVTARVSSEADWPGGGSSVIGPSSVIMISGEDDAEDTIVPRLMAAGADLSKVQIMDGVVEKRDGELSALSLDKHARSVHAAMLRAKAKLLVIDPVSAFMGDRDSHKDTAVRALISRLRQYAYEGDYAVLLVTHFNKPGEKVASAVHRVMGSLGFVAAARSVYAFVRDPADPDHRLFLPIKNNLGPDKEGFRCHIDVDRTQVLSPPPAYLQWDDEAVEGQRVDDVLTQSSPRRQARMAKEQEIGKWLDSRIKRGKRVRATKFNRELKELGYSERLARELMPQFGYRKVQEGFPAKWWVVRENLQ